MPVLEDQYPSRVLDAPERLERRDPVVYGEGPAPVTLTRERLEAYDADGFISIEQLFSPEEVRDFTAELNRLRRDEGMKERPETITELGSGEVRSIFRVHALSPVFDRLSRDPRLLDVARYLLGDDVYIHQSRVNFKPGFQGKEFYWHSDFETWHVEDGMPRMRAVSVSVALTENNEFNGPLMLIPGSHRHFIACVGRTPENHYLHSLKKQEYGVPDPENLAWLADQGGIRAPKGPAGSATFFECNTMHGSSSNISPWPRSNVFFVYNSVSNRVVEPFGGMKPRPEHIATRVAITPLQEGS
jgi:ectoine hydroxylase